MSLSENLDSDNGDSFFYLTYSLYERLKNEIFTSMFPWLIVSATLALCIRIILRYMFNFCATNTGGIHYMPQERAIEVTKYFNPFTFTLHASNSSYSGVTCTLRSLEDCYVVPIWGVPIYELFQLLHENWYNIKDSICNSSFQSKCLGGSDYFILNGGEELIKEFIPPENFDSSSMEVLPCPRLQYPFVIIMMTTSIPVRENLQLVLLVNVIHIPDKIIKLPSQIYQQFAKSADGTVAMIKNIYPGSFETSYVENETVELCLVCMHREISIVIIPCGHACVCRACFELCKNCPICRGPAHYFFVSCAVSRH